MARQWALAYPFFFKSMLNQERFRELQPEEVRKDAAKLAELHRKQTEAYRHYFHEDVRRQLGNDPNQYIAYYREALEFLRPKTGSSFPFEVDKDVQGLGLSNRKLELLDQCVSMLERNDRTELALRILRRYTTQDFSDAQGWRSWLDANRRRLFFTEVGGYKFRIAPEPSESRVAIPDDGAIPDAKHPIVAHAEISPATARAGETLELIVRVKVAATWHIYAVGGSHGPGVSTTLNLTLPKGVEAQGEWACPQSVRGKDGQMIYEGTLEFRRRLRVAKGAAEGPIDVCCEFAYQACDPFSCRLPTNERLTAKGVVRNPLGNNPVLPGSNR